MNQRTMLQLHRYTPVPTLSPDCSSNLTYYDHIATGARDEIVNHNMVELLLEQVAGVEQQQQQQ